MAETRISRSQNLQVTDVRKGRMSGASDVRKGRKSVNSARVWGSGRPGKVGRPVLREGPDVRKTPVVRWVGVNARCEFGARFWAENGDFGVKIHGISWMKDGEIWGDARSN